MSLQSLSSERPVMAHYPVGASTGWLAADQRAAGEAPEWPVLAGRAKRQFAGAVELAALSEPELPALIEWLVQRPSLPFDFLSLHAPSKARALPEPELVALLAQVSERVDAIVLHPDVIEDHAAWALLGRALVIENMDPRKQDGRTADSLAPHFEQLPEAGLCFDVAHAYAIDPTLAEGHAILDRFGDRLRHLHVSALDAAHHHVALNAQDEERIRPLLERCRDVPWILEAPLA
ncbi:MAG: hypothetical protein Q7T55_13230 [Solirubrobacteraceae bacterium]|nr:hypothetical protein [Solirubrobacteraceae bacterium]